MQIKFKLLNPYKKEAGKEQVVIEIEKGNLTFALKQLAKRFPKLKKHFFDENWEVENSLSVFLNGQPCFDTNTELKDRDEILLFMAISGG